MYRSLGIRITKSHGELRPGTINLLIGLSGGGKTRSILEDLTARPAIYISLGLFGNGGSAAGQRCIALCSGRSDSERDLLWTCLIGVFTSLFRNNSSLAALVNPLSAYGGKDPALELMNALPTVADWGASDDQLLEARRLVGDTIVLDVPVYWDEIQVLHDDSASLTSLFRVTALQAVLPSLFAGTGVRFSTVQSAVPKTHSGTAKAPANRDFACTTTLDLAGVKAALNTLCPQRAQQLLELLGTADELFWFSCIRPRLVAHFIEDFEQTSFDHAILRFYQRLLDASDPQYIFGHSDFSAPVIVNNKRLAYYLAELALNGALKMASWSDSDRDTFMMCSVGPLHEHSCKLAEPAAQRALVAHPAVTTKYPEVLLSCLTATTERSSQGFAFEIVGAYSIAYWKHAVEPDKVRIENRRLRNFLEFLSTAADGLYVCFPDKHAGSDIVICNISDGDLTLYVVQAKWVQQQLAGADKRHAESTTDLLHSYTPKSGKPARVHLDDREAISRWHDTTKPALVRALLTPLDWRAEVTTIQVWNRQTEVLKYFGDKLGFDVWTLAPHKD